MQTIPSSTGRLWIKQGYQFFRKQPGEFVTLFFAYLICGLVIGVIAELAADWVPHLGQALTFIFVPLFTMAFMQACLVVERGEKVRARLILTAFRSPRLPSLLALGLLYLAAAWVALQVSMLVDGGEFYLALNRNTEPVAAAPVSPNVTLAMLTTIGVFVVEIVPLWFVAPLIAWQNMSLFKALFYSFFASLRMLHVFVVYALCWFLVAGLAPAMVATLLLLLTGSRELVLILIMPVSIISTIVLHCTFYPSYRTVFDAPDQPSTIS